MKKYKLLRRYFKFGTFSELVDESGSVVCVMVEREWKNNKPCVSCIPEGVYTAKRVVSPKYGTCYAMIAEELGVSLAGKTKRTHCLIHIANVPGELQGCLAPGEDFGTVYGEWGVVHSGDAFIALMDEFAGEDVQIEIVKA